MHPRWLLLVSATALPILLLAWAPREPEAQQAGCIVGRVVDGDTFFCRDGRRVRLIGVDSPERKQGAVAVAARKALARMLPTATPVRLQHDVRLTDRYGRLLAYAWVGTVLVNEAMVRNGWAVLYTVPPNVMYAERLRRAQDEARARRAGLWGWNGFDCLPSDYRRGVCLSSP